VSAVTGSRGDKMDTMYYNEFLLYGAIEPDSKNFKDHYFRIPGLFQCFPGPMPFFLDFPGLEISGF